MQRQHLAPLPLVDFAEHVLDEKVRVRLRRVPDVEPTEGKVVPRHVRDVAVGCLLEQGSHRVFARNLFEGADRAGREVVAGFNNGHALLRPNSVGGRSIVLTARPSCPGRSRVSVVVVIALTPPFCRCRVT